MIQIVWSHHKPLPATTATSFFPEWEEVTEKGSSGLLENEGSFPELSPGTSEINLFSSHLGWQKPHFWWRLTGWKIMKKGLQLSSWLPCYQACAHGTKEMIWPLWAKRELGMGLASWFNTVWPPCVTSVIGDPNTEAASLHNTSFWRPLRGTGSSLSPLYRWGIKA